MFFRRFAMVVLAIAIPLTASAQLGRNERKQGFKALFNGRDLAGWEVMGDQSWRVEQGILICSGQGHGWLKTNQEYENFTLRLEYKISPKGNSGVFIRALREGNPAFSGMELQVMDDFGQPPSKHSSMGIYAAVAPTKNMSKPAGEWNTVEITALGPKLKIVFNGEQVVNANLADAGIDTEGNPKLPDRAKQGFIGLQNHGTAVEYRMLRIKELTPSSGEWASPVGARRGEEVDLLAPRVNNSDVKQRLMKMGTPAVKPLFKVLGSSDKALVFEARSALRWIAERSATSVSQRDALVPVLTDVVKTSKEPATRAFAVELLGTSHSEKAIPELSKLLADQAVCDTAVNSLERIPGKGSLKALIAGVSHQSAQARAACAAALGRRRDPAAVTALTAATKDKQESVRLAAIEALGKIGDPKGLTAIEGALAKGTAPVKEAACLALVRMGDAELARQRPATALALDKRALSQTKTETTVLAALDGLAKTGSPQAESVVTPLAMRGAPQVRIRAIHTLSKLPGKDATATLVMAAAPSEPPAVRYAAVEALAVRRDPAAAATLAMASKNGSEDLRAAAVKALAAFPTTESRAALSQALASDSPMVRDAAVKANLQMADGLMKRKELVAALGIYQSILNQAKSDDEKVTALDGMRRIADPSSLPAVTKQLDSPEPVRTAAVNAWIAIADGLAAKSRKNEAIAIYNKALETMPGGMAADLVAARLRDLGVAFSSPQGFVTDWWVIGPFVGPELTSWDQHYFPEQGIDLKKTYTQDGKQMRWTHQVTDSGGVLDLVSLMSPSENASAYAYEEISVDAAQDVYLKMGSDDGITCWLNGQIVNDKREMRGLTPDQDRVDAHLVAGTNKILLKIMNGGGGWSYCLRITDRQNRPVKFKLVSL